MKIEIAEYIAGKNGAIDLHSSVGHCIQQKERIVPSLFQRRRYPSLFARGKPGVHTIPGCPCLFVRDKSAVQEAEADRLTPLRVPFCLE